ncbi:hypothetical protein [Denitromonas iodatirespirans]|uniref:Tetratricopeptide repeat protein n=1 Tax=Denitromonas iodatirespirans TaxID=2795389 RepID=A0A944HF08_DENI1|nr:hypothetical protein [Denitromonas iodatirespirans]MBT0963326.1 hypothetical protein [Denitromonas iodatirespirans]
MTVIARLARHVALAVALGPVAGVQAVPFTPAHDDVVIERLPFRAGDAEARELASLRAALARAPDDRQAAAELARQYFDTALAKGDPRYVGYAEAVVGRFAEPLPADLLLVRGMLRQYRHDFDAALDDFAAALARDPDLAGAHAWRAAIHLVRADYARAADECEALARLGRRVLAGGCTGLTLAYTGHLDQAEATLTQALAAANAPGNRQWLLTRLGEVAAWRGRPTEAERHYREALAIGQDDTYLLAAWADFLLDQGRPAEVVDALQDWVAADVLLLRLVEAETRLDRPAAASHRQALADRYAAARLRGDATHRAEEARFALRIEGDAATALTLAADNYRVQREPRDARILLEAAVAAGDPDAARPALDWLATSGFEDAHLRDLAQQLGQPSGGKDGTR